MKLNFEMYIEKMHYYQIVSCVKTFEKKELYDSLLIEMKLSNIQ